MVIAYEPPRDIWKVNQSLRIDEPLDGDRDPRWVDTEAARGEYSLDRICRALGVDRDKRILTAPDHGYYLFCGHRGSGKSTELRRIARELHHGDLYYVVFADAAQELDVNNLRYEDALLHLAGRLTAKLHDDGISVEPVYLHKLQDWFTERVEKTDKIKEFSQEARAGVKAAVGLPFLVNVFAHFSAAFRTNATYKEELRRTVRNHFTAFSDGFNLLINAAEDRDVPSARRAVREMAAHYRRFLRPDDYRLLAAIDAGQSPAADTGRVNDLLYNLALLEYNEFYWRSHPVIRTTPEYRTARDAIDSGE